MKLGKSFCWRPFVQLDIMNTDELKPCCKFQLPVKDETFNDLWKDVRLSILNGDFHPGCVKCWEAEQSGFKNTERLSYYGPRDKAVVLENRYDLKFISISVDNICNLACATCNSKYSSKWAAEEKKMDGIQPPKVKAADLKKIMDKNIWKNVERLALYGGEPLYSANALQLLEWLVEEGISEKIVLSFITNSTVITDKIQSRLKKFRAVEFTVSIDSIGDRFELMRWPASWNTVRDNFHKLESDSKVINYTYSVLNAYNLIEDLAEIRQDLTHNIHISILQSPDYYSAHHLPLEIKEELIEKYRNDAQASTLIPFLRKPGNPDKFRQAIEKLKKLDSFRGTDCKILGPMFN